MVAALQRHERMARKFGGFLGAPEQCGGISTLPLLENKVNLTLLTQGGGSVNTMWDDDLYDVSRKE